MEDFEKLGAFYLGKRYSLEDDQLTDELILYDSKDLNTHAVIIGMTGSGKTGLGIGLIEEAALDHVPVIAIDPKGDLGNLLLTFPSLAASDFQPWVDPAAATRKGMDVVGFAAAQAKLWRKGLADWGQGPERIAALREAVELRLLTPGSVSGTPVSALRSFRCPTNLIVDDPDLYRDSIQTTATGILALLGEVVDPLTSREHILLARILEHVWNDGRDLDLPGLIAAIQSPGFDRIGVMELDAFYPAKDRFALAMKINSLLAAPGFEAWTQGEPLDAASLLYNAAGKPRVSVLSIAHLSDQERMFFVTLLLNEIIRWMRAQPGTGSLRAVLYMDELFGYMPPVANPPSKQLFLTLLKQARAYGLGLVLSTQNPVDLDYKGLSNTGTWFIGRLQTERDKARVMEGLEGAGAAGEFDRGRMEKILAGLGKRRFLLHNVHDSEPVVFGTRWVMSYLAGPLTRQQIKRLRPEVAPGANPTPAPVSGGEALLGPPLLPPDLAQYFVPVAAHLPDQIAYAPVLLAQLRIGFHSARQKVDLERTELLLFTLQDGATPIRWDDPMALSLGATDLLTAPETEAHFREVPGSILTPGESRKAQRKLVRWVRNERGLKLLKSPALRLTSTPDESEGDFRARLQLAGNERRDQAVEKLKARYESKATTLNNRLLRAQQAVERESQQARQKKLDVAVSVGTAILGAVFGRRALSTTSAGKIGTAVKGYGRTRKEAGDVARAKETVAAVQQQLAELAETFDQDVAELDSAYDAQSEQLTEVLIRAKLSDIHVEVFGLGWLPHARDGEVATGAGLWLED
jgi:hypothetical protein